MVTPGSDITEDIIETTMSYDEDGFMLSSTVDPGGLNLTTSYQPDGLGRVQTVIDPMGRATRFAYDKRGNRTHTTVDFTEGATAGLNLTTVNAYDTLGRLHTTTDPKNQTLTYTYWNETSLTLTLKDARNNVTSWTYNNRGQILSKLYPNGDDHAYTYDVLGRMQTHTTPENHICTYTYDPRDRVTLSDWNSTTPDTHRDYWPGGLIKFIDNGISRSDYHYNSRKLLTSEIQTISGQSPRTVSYDYDADGLRTGLDYPSGVAIDMSGMYLTDDPADLRRRGSRHVVGERIEIIGGLIVGQSELARGVKLFERRAVLDGELVTVKSLYSRENPAHSRKRLQVNVQDLGVCPHP